MAATQLVTPGLADLGRSYRAAFLWYVSTRQEAALHEGYRIGRAAVTGGSSILDLVGVHHEVLLEVLSTSAAEEVAAVAGAAAEFLAEVLATYQMTQPGTSSEP